MKHSSPATQTRPVTSIRTCGLRCAQLEKGRGCSRTLRPQCNRLLEFDATSLIHAAIRRTVQWHRCISRDQRHCWHHFLIPSAKTPRVSTLTAPSNTYLMDVDVGSLSKYLVWGVVGTDSTSRLWCTSNVRQNACSKSRTAAVLLRRYSVPCHLLPHSGHKAY
jgi:hypothetical protein